LGKAPHNFSILQEEYIAPIHADLKEIMKTKEIRWN